MHDHGDEREDDRTSDIELFFKRYENMTGGSGQNGVLHGLEVRPVGDGTGPQDVWVRRRSSVGLSGIPRGLARDCWSSMGMSKGKAWGPTTAGSPSQ